MDQIQRFLQRTSSLCRMLVIAIEFAALHIASSAYHAYVAI